MEYAIGGIHISKEGFKLYEQIKHRDDRHIVDPNSCKKIVYTFAKEGRLDGPGTYAGACGV